MSDDPIRTRFAPSPTGALHLGNVRTALFNCLYARGRGGRFVLRSEDTDAERSADASLAALTDTLEWLGLRVDEGPAHGGPYGPYRQSERSGLYTDALTRLQDSGHAYRCYCTREELAETRRRQLAAGQPPRYPGTCRDLAADERAEREAAGRVPTIRFRVPDEGTVVFDDLVLGRQTARLREIGDFIIARSDGSPAFFLANAVDDVEMGITHVLRGEDHLTNTPRQLLLLEALGYERLPRYGHFGLILDMEGRPLSKRRGGAMLDELRGLGYRPEALINHLVRIGYAPPGDGLMELPQLAAAFDPARVATGGARHDTAALEGWQRQALDRLDAVALWDWMAAGEPDDAITLPVEGPVFAAAIRPNVLFPGDAWRWARRLFDPQAEPEGDARAEIAAAGPGFFRAALTVQEPAPEIDFGGWAKAVGAAAGVRGRGLYRPLRAALTNAVEGPELGAVVPLMPAELVTARLQACAAD
jgi:glutamyl-tRNA synthetase